MLRLAAIAIVLVAPLLTQRAAAQDCLCVIGEGFGFAAVETPDTTIESTDPIADAASATDTAPPVHHGVLWCASSSDPRCQPMQPSDVPTLRALSSGSVGAQLTQLSRGTRRFAIEIAPTPRFGLAPSIGVASSLDRPPRH